MQYNNAGQLARWQPAPAEIAPLNITYDTLGRVRATLWGDRQVEYGYDRFGRLNSIGLPSPNETPLRRRFGYESDGLNWVCFWGKKSIQNLNKLFSAFHCSTTIRS